MSDNAWTIERLAKFQEKFGISNSLLARMLGLDRSTITKWQKRANEDLLPDEYWPSLDVYEEKCRQVSSDANWKLANSYAGSAVATALGLVVAGPLGALVGAGLSSYFQSPLPKMPEANLKPDERECPRCAEVIKRKAVFCRFCRSDIEKG